MSLNRIFPCPDCGSDVSKKASAYPHCGSPIAGTDTPTTVVVKEKKSIGCAGILGILFLGMLVFSALDVNDGPSATKNSEPPVPKTAAELRIEEIQGAFSAWDGSHRVLERWIKRRLKDPDSYKHVETRYGDKGDHILVVTTYRARNSFGGYTTESVTAKAAVDGTLLEIISNP